MIVPYDATQGHEGRSCDERMGVVKAKNLDRLTMRESMTMDRPLTVLWI